MVGICDMEDARSVEAYPWRAERARAVETKGTTLYAATSLSLKVAQP